MRVGRLDSFHEVFASLLFDSEQLLEVSTVIFLFILVSVDAVDREALSQYHFALVRP